MLKSSPPIKFDLIEKIFASHSMLIPLSTLDSDIEGIPTPIFVGKTK